MKKIFKIVVIILILSAHSMLKCDDAGDSANQALDNLKGLWDGAGKFVTGMASAFGYVPDDAKYSFRVWNDSPGVIAAASQEVTKVLGAGFSGTVTDVAMISAYCNTGGYFASKKLYYIVWILIDKNNKDYSDYKKTIDEYAKIGAFAQGAIGAAIGALAGSIKTTVELEKYKLLSKSITQPDKDNVYYYRAYTEQGNIKAEFLGVKTTTQDFSGVFYNSSKAQDISLQFVKDDISYKVALEAGTFSLLNSTSGNPTSIRSSVETCKYSFLDQTLHPKSKTKLFSLDDTVDKTKLRTFVFSQGSNVLATIPLSSEGICNVQQDPATNKLIPGSPMVATYEVYQGSQGPAVGMQGLAVGHYTQPFDSADQTKNVVRDINPMSCNLWYQSVDEENKTLSSENSTQKAIAISEQVWIFYKTKDYTYQKKVEIGSLINFTLMRPRLSEQKATLYVVALQTQNDTQALQFLNRLADGTLVQNLDEPLTTVADFNINTVLTTIQPNTRGVIDDTKGTGNSGTKGFVVVTDTIFPRGVGTGPFYYVIKPALLDISSLVSQFAAYLDPKKFTQPTAMQQELMQKIEQWVTTYASNQASVSQQVTNYIEQKGVDAILTSLSTPARSLNDQGKKAVQNLISGPMSIAHYPAQHQAGTNEYVFNLGATPKDWPIKK